MARKHKRFLEKEDGEDSPVSLHSVDYMVY